MSELYRIAKKGNALPFSVSKRILVTLLRKTRIRGISVTLPRKINVRQTSVTLSHENGTHPDELFYKLARPT